MAGPILDAQTITDLQTRLSGIESMLGKTNASYTYQTGGTGAAVRKIASFRKSILVDGKGTGTTVGAVKWYSGETSTITFATYGIPSPSAIQISVAYGTAEKKPVTIASDWGPNSTSCKIYAWSTGQASVLVDVTIFE